LARRRICVFRQCRFPAGLLFRLVARLLLKTVAQAKHCLTDSANLITTLSARDAGIEIAGSHAIERCRKRCQRPADEHSERRKQQARDDDDAESRQCEHG
jgi:hypothetical protein